MEATGARLVRYKQENAEFSLVPIADIHKGNSGCAHNVLKRDIESIRADPFSAWMLLGDYCDWIGPGDKRWDSEAVGHDITARDLGRLAARMIDDIYRELEPIKNRCLACGMGNHEVKYFSATSQQQIHERFCEMLGAPNIRYSGWFDVYFQHAPRMKNQCEWIVHPDDRDIARPGQVRLRVLCHHGAGAAQTPGGKINRLNSMLTSFDADLIVMGHVHEQMARARTPLGVDRLCREIQERGQLGLITGSYLRTYASGQTSYGEIRGYAPTTLGATRARYIPAARRLIAENTVTAGVPL